MLEISYYAAHLILAVRCIAENLDVVCQDSFNGINFKSPPYIPSFSTQDEVPHSPATPTSQEEHRRHRKKHEALACKYAMLMIRRSINIQTSLVIEMPEYLKLCLAYSTFVITHYQPDPEIAPEMILDSLRALEAKARSIFYFRPNPLTATIIARQNLEKRFWGSTQDRAEDDQATPSCEQDIAHDGSFLHRGQTPAHLRATNSQYMGQNTMWRPHDDVTMASFDLETSFPSIEDFFAGSFTLPDLELDDFVGIA